jgi:hypothetical protein
MRSALERTVGGVFEAHWVHDRDRVRVAALGEERLAGPGGVNAHARREWARQQAQEAS